MTQDRELEEWFQDGFLFQDNGCFLLSALHCYHICYHAWVRCMPLGRLSPQWKTIPALWHFIGPLGIRFSLGCDMGTLDVVESCDEPLEFMSEPAEDGMDQSKFALPRNRIIQSSKEASAFVRPRIKLHGLWVHGISLNLYVIHPGVPADSSLIIECFSLALQDAIDMLERAGKQVPKECLVWVFQLQWVPNFWRLLFSFFGGRGLFN